MIDQRLADALDQIREAVEMIEMVAEDRIIPPPPRVPVEPGVGYVLVPPADAAWDDLAEGLHGLVQELNKVQREGGLIAVGSGWTLVRADQVTIQAKE